MLARKRLDLLSKPTLLVAPVASMLPFLRQLLFKAFFQIFNFLLHQGFLFFELTHLLLLVPSYLFCLLLVSFFLLDKIVTHL